MTITKDELKEVINLINDERYYLKNFISSVKNNYDTSKEQKELKQWENLMTRLQSELYSNKKNIEVNIEEEITKSDIYLMEHDKGAFDI